MTQSHAGNEYARRLAEQARTPENFKVEPRVYFHRHNYAKFHFDLGIPGATKTVAFANYRYITDDKREQDQLDMVADVPGTMVYTLKDSEVNAALEQELKQEQRNSVVAAAQAQAAAHGQNFDPNVPIVPVNVQHIGQSPGIMVNPMQQAPQGVAVVGMQNSLSGTQATGDMSLNPVIQTASPDAAAEALARLQMLTNAAKNS